MIRLSGQSLAALFPSAVASVGGVWIATHGAMLHARSPSRSKCTMSPSENVGTVSGTGSIRYS